MSKLRKALKCNFTFTITMIENELIIIIKSGNTYHIRHKIKELNIFEQLEYAAEQAIRELSKSRSEDKE